MQATSFPAGSIGLSNVMCGLACEADATTDDHFARGKWRSFRKRKKRRWSLR